MTEDRTFRLRQTLNIIFMILAVAGIIIYFAVGDFWGKAVIMLAVVVKMAETCFRLIKR
ncbi:MAG: hypothetical protein KBS94_03665 [Prevotella sp.]|nr:hypothetical protein [Candidatus Equicola faecalis]MDO4819141.1 hypothetical protein [Prevotella sp.]